MQTWTQNAVTESIDTDTKLAQHPVTKQTNRLALLMAGEQVPDVVRKASAMGRVSQLWNPYIGGNNRFARKGVTGAEIAQVLCAAGDLDYKFKGEIVKAGTPIESQPAWEDLREENGQYRFVKAPRSRDSFNNLMPSATERNLASVK